MSSSEAPGAEPPPPGAAARLQPDQWDPSAWADMAGRGLSPDERSRADDIDRRLGDRTLVEKLRAAGFEGQEWQTAAEELARYGVDVLHSWVRKGTIYEKCAQRKRFIKRPPEGALDAAEGRSLVNGTVAAALQHFREDVLIPGVWDPAKGASITTFFVGQCLMRFPDIYRPWLNQVRKVERGTDIAKVQLSQRVSPVEDDVIVSMTNRSALTVVRNRDARVAFVMIAMDYTQVQIAEYLGTTPKAVERMLDYARKQIDKQRRSA